MFKPVADDNHNEKNTKRFLLNSQGMLDSKSNFQNKHCNRFLPDSDENQDLVGDKYLAVGHINFIKMHNMNSFLLL